MDFIEVEGKTYEEAVRKAAMGLNVSEKDLEIDVKEVDTKGILGLLGSKKVRITARLRGKGVEQPREVEEAPQTTDDTGEGPDEYGIAFLRGLGEFIGLTLLIKVTKQEDRHIFLVQCDHGDALIGKDGEVLEALQYLLKLALAKRFRENLKLTIDLNGFREKRKKAITVMAKRLADRAKRTGRSLKTDPLNPYERRIIHTLLKHNKGVTTKSEGDGHIKQVIISPVGGRRMHGRR